MVKGLDRLLAIRNLFAVTLKQPLNKDNLPLTYTPGVAEVCLSIHAHPSHVDMYTNRRNMVAVISKGNFLGVKPLSTLPLLDWYCYQLKYYANLDAFPIAVCKQADMGQVINDLGASMSGIVLLDSQTPKNLDKDIVIVDQLRLSEITGKPITQAEDCSYIMRRLLAQKKYGFTQEQTLQEMAKTLKFSLSSDNCKEFQTWIKPMDRLLSKFTNKENSLFLHQYLQGKIQSQLAYLNINLLKELATKDQILRLVKLIEEDQSVASKITSKRNLCAIITDGTAVLGLGNIGQRAALPVMQGKSCLFKQLGDVNVIPICIKPRKDTKDATKAIMNILSGLAAINLEDISAPSCFDIEENLKKSSGLPIFHDDQHGTAVVVLAGLINALKLRRKPISECKVVINGAGAAGLTIAKLLFEYGFKTILVCDTKGTIYKGRSDLNSYKKQIAQFTNAQSIKGQLKLALKAADIFIGVSVQKALKPQWVTQMNQKPIIFALANPIPQIFPHQAQEKGAFITATGRSDFPNQINNSLVFPGIFKGILQTKAREVTMRIKIAASQAIAKAVSQQQLSTKKIIPNSMQAQIPLIIAQQIVNIVGKH